MKRILLSLVVATTTAFGLNAQVGAVAPNFTQDDLNGTTHDLYTHLDNGKVVVVDMSATWCGPCWGFHQTHYLEDLHQEFGPNGTNEVVVIFYEDDVNTTLADLQGTGGNTQGDWVTGVTYPIINATVALAYPEYGTGYPTVSVICPTDRKIKATIPTGGTYAQIRQTVQSVIDECVTSSASIDEQETIELSIAPNPTSDATVIRFNSNAAETVTINLYGVTGQVISTMNYQTISGKNAVDFDMSSFDAGTYFIKVTSQNAASSMMQVVKR